VAQRPSLTGLSIVDELESVLATRQPLYHDAAHHVLKADAPQEEVIQQIMAKLNLS
jgi:shikimate kinase